MDVDVCVLRPQPACVLDSGEASVLLPKSRISKGGGDGEGESLSKTT